MGLAFERLEDRLLLAASAVKQGTTLIITDDGGGDDVDLTGGAEGNVNVAGAASGNGLHTGIKNIKIVGDAGVDDYTLVDINITGNVTADLKDNNDYFEILGLTAIDGNVTVKAGDGDDQVYFNANSTGDTIDVGKNVKVDLGNSVVINNEYFAIFGTGVDEKTTIGGGLTVRGKDGEQTVQVENTEITKNLNVNLANGSDTVYIGAQRIGFPNDVTIDGNAIIRVGDGDDYVDITPYHDGTNLFNKNLTVDLGNAETPTGDLFWAIPNTAVTKIVHVVGNLSIKGKDGIQFLHVDFTDVDKNLNINLGNGDDHVEVNQLSAGLLTTIGGNAKINLGAGENDELIVEDTTVTGKATLDGGQGGNDEADSPNGGLTFGANSPAPKNFEVGNLVP